MKPNRKRMGFFDLVLRLLHIERVFEFVLHPYMIKLLSMIWINPKK